MTERITGTYEAFPATVRTNVAVIRIKQIMSAPAMRAGKSRFLHWLRLGNSRRLAKLFLLSPCIVANPYTRTTNSPAIRPSRIQFIERVAVFALSLLAEWMGISKYARGMWKAILVSRIAHVVSVISEKEMARIAAGRIIAAMKDALSFWYGADQKLPCEAMRENFVVRAINLAADSDLAVSVLVSLSLPEPTFIR